MCPALPNNSDNWNASAYAALSVASQISSALKTQAARLSLAHNMWKLDRAFRDCLEGIYEAAENPNPVPPAEPITEEKIRHVANLCHALHASIEGLYQNSKSRTLTNSYLVGVVFNSVRARAEELLDIGDSLDAYMDPETDMLLNQAITDLHSGSVDDLPAFK